MCVWKRERLDYFVIGEICLQRASVQLVHHFENRFLIFKLGLCSFARPHAHVYVVLYSLSDLALI